MLLEIGNILKEAKYLGWGKDKHNESIVAHIFETAINGDKSWIIVREFTFKKHFLIHSISDNESILKYTKNHLKNRASWNCNPSYLLFRWSCTTNICVFYEQTKYHTKNPGHRIKILHNNQWLL